MLRDESVVVESSWAGGDGAEAWRDLDRQLCSVAERRGALDHEELTLIREAGAVQLWRPLGMTSMREYLERRMGYGPQVAAERLRIAEALEALPAIEGALASGELSYSAVRELTRIATRKTDEAWVKACRGKVLRQIEELVAEREPGDPPESKPKPQVRRRRFCADLLPDVDALVRQARQVLEAEHGEKLDNDELMRALAARVLEPAVSSDKAQRPRHQIAVTVCKACKQGWQTGAGREIPISAVDVEVALCDGQHVDERGKLTQAIPAPTRRAVWRRDHGRCRIPGCRASCFIDVHHLVPRAHGGTHEMSNLALLCAGHHRALHAGLIVIEGSAPDFRVIWLTEVPHVGEAVLDEARGSQPRDGVDAEEVTHMGEPALDDVDRIAGADAAAMQKIRLDSCGNAARRSEPRDGVDAEEVPHVGDSCIDEARWSEPREDIDADEVPHVGEPTLGGARRSEAHEDIDADEVPHVGELRMAADVEAGLVRLGFRRAEARDAVARARKRGASTDAETLMRAALRECPRPTR